MRAYSLLLIGILLVVIAILGAIYVFFTPPTHSTPEAQTLAACLAGKGAVMYGAAWCPHCQNEKHAFGVEAFALIPYVECPVERARCVSIGIHLFPTWIFGNPSTNSGQVAIRLEGEQGLAKLAAQSGCPYLTP